MPMAAVIHEKGTPDVFRWEEVEIGSPGKGEIRIRNEAVGVNYVDTYHRRGMPHPWPVPALPLVSVSRAPESSPKSARASTGLSPGDLVGYAMPPHGAYSQERIYPAEKAVRVPDGIDARAVAAPDAQGAHGAISAQADLAGGAGRCDPGARGGGRHGPDFVQWGKHLGATVIGTVSTEEKAEQARAAGCDHAVVHGAGDFVATVKEVTGGEGCAVVYESIGKDTFRRSMDCLRPLGMMASYGHASGAPDPVDVIELGARGSLFLTRPAIMHYMARREDLVAGSRELFEVVQNGAVKPAVTTSTRSARRPRRTA